jgi:hypothetical protein
MIADEDDVRAIFRKASGGAARWVEPARGSTAGLPDCWAPWQGSCVHVELKAGVVDKGVLKYEVRTAQKIELRRMIADQIPCGLAIGVIGSETVICALPTEIALAGKLPLVDEGRFWVPVGPHVADYWRTIMSFYFLNVAKLDELS